MGTYSKDIGDAAMNNVLFDFFFNLLAILLAASNLFFQAPPHEPLIDDQWISSDEPSIAFFPTTTEYHHLSFPITPMAEYPKRRRYARSSGISDRPRVFPRDPSTPATADDKRNWNGFCELESEPVSANFSEISSNFRRLI